MVGRESKVAYAIVRLGYKVEPVTKVVTIAKSIATMRAVGGFPIGQARGDPGKNGKTYPRFGHDQTRWLSSCEVLNVEVCIRRITKGTFYRCPFVGHHVEESRRGRILDPLRLRTFPNPFWLCPESMPMYELGDGGAYVT